jgi:hypothetical protein
MRIRSISRAVLNESEVASGRIETSLRKLLLKVPTLAKAPHQQNMLAYMG